MTIQKPLTLQEAKSIARLHQWRGCTRSATHNQGSGITPGAIMLRAPVSSWPSIGRKPQDRSRGPPIPPLRGQIVRQHRRPRSRAAARAARPATSSMCASSTPNRYVDHDPTEWTMTPWIERPRLRLRLPVTPRIAAAHTSGAPARTGCDPSAITRPNHRARHYRTAAHPRAPRQTAITSLRGHLENP